MIFRKIALFAAVLLSATGVQAAGDAAKGAAIATTVCVACHAADGNSVMPANPKLAGQHAEYIVKQLKNFKAGTRANPVMGPMASTLSEDDVANLAAYFSAQTPKAGAAKSNGPGSDGEKIYRGGVAAKGVPACAACHGPNGAGIPVQFPRLAGQHAEYVTNQLKAFRSGERANAPMMKTIAAKLSDPEIAAVADYMQGLK
ncbi:cytochrome c4 [mine drainage metagenome]|uniref:Cytochrome c4 n=1 Tax=mine drainage metagenome TaxID=410659 RepID=A0A1J5Q621_9ZZZZ